MYVCMFLCVCIYVYKIAVFCVFLFVQGSALGASLRRLATTG